MSKIPGWALQTIDLALTDEDEICASIDDVIDDDQAFMFVDGNEDVNRPLAVMISWKRYVHMTALALAVPAKPHLPNPQVAGNVSPGEVSEE